MNKVSIDVTVVDKDDIEAGDIYLSGYNDSGYNDKYILTECGGKWRAFNLQSGRVWSSQENKKGSVGGLKRIDSGTVTIKIGEG